MVTLEEKPVERSSEFIAQLRSQRSTTVQPEIDGIVTRIFVKPGDRVRLGTPLAQIKLFTETLRTGRATTPEQRDWSLGHIDREATRLASLVDNVLRFEAKRRGGEETAGDVDVAAEAQAVVDEFRPIAASRNATVRASIAPTPAVRMQPDALRRVLLNYLDNAVKYGPVGQTVDVDVGAQNGSIVVAVSDQGPGVPAAERERIWEPFTRGRAGSSKSTE